MNAQLEELVSQPGAPNMYWALSSLPRPFIDLRISTEAEYCFVYLMYPELRDIELQRRPPEYWSRLLEKLASDVANWNDDAWKDYSKLSLAARTAQRYPQAKRRLIESGRSPEEVAAMPVAQVVLLYTMQIYDESRDALFKWFALPYPEAKAGLDKFQTAWTDVRDREIVPLFSVLAPATGAVANASARHERSFAMLRTIEAMRLYAAAHGGQPPQRLEDVSEVPVPIDPFSGKSFIYRAEGDTAVLEAPLPPGMGQQHYGLRYEITFAR
jgi:hypothetical protein